MNARIFHCVALIGFFCLIATATAGCHSSGGQDSTAAKSSAVSASPAAQTPAMAAPAAQEPVVVGGGCVQTKSEGQGNTALIFVNNRLGEKYNEYKNRLQDYIVAESTKVGYSCMEPENVQESITPGDLDRLMKSGSSRLAMVRTLGADYLLVVNLTDLDVVTANTVMGGDLPCTKKTYTLALTYNVADRNLGGALTGDTITMTTSTMENAANKITFDPIKQLLRDGAREMAAGFKKSLPPPPPLGMAGFRVDVRVQSFEIPNIMRNDKGEYVVSSEKFHLLAEKADVELDGSKIGTTPQRLSGPKGLHKMRVTRDGCRPWEGNITINEGAEFVVDLQLTDETIQRFQQMSTFMSGLKTSEKFSDAGAEAIRGFAQALRQSGFKVDVKADLESKDLKALNMISKCFWSSGS